jgi:hypothetical protein
MKPIANFPGYWIYPDGRVWSGPKKTKRKGTFLKTHKCTNGYRFITLYVSGVSQMKLIHRLVAEAFILNPLSKPHVNHINGIKHDNRVENLEWVTLSENMQHAAKLGLLQGVKGSKNVHSKLTESDVLEIRRLYVPGKVSMKELAGMFGVCEQHISVIIRRKKWAHLPSPIQETILAA